MSFYVLLLSLAAPLLFTACVSTPGTALSPELSRYSLAQENCRNVRNSITSPSELSKTCNDFLNRLEKVKAVEEKIELYEKRYTDARSKPEYIRLQTTAHRQHLKAKQDYESLTDTLNRFSQESIAEDKLSDVVLTLTFPETVFTKEHYLYYKEYTPRFDQDPRYTAYQKKYAQELFRKGLQHLGKGNKQTALKRFEKAASLHDSEAEYFIGLLYEDKHIDKAIAWHTKAEKHGVKASRLHLARLHERYHEPKKAQKWYLKAANDDDTYAQYMLYKLYSKSTSEKVIGISKEWLKRSAENGYPPAMYTYAQQLLKEKRTAMAEEWLIKAQSHGLAAASAALGELYFKEERYKEAYPLLRDAKSASARYSLGVMYENGLGVDIDFYKAYKLYGQALRLGENNAKYAMVRVDSLKTEKEMAYYKAERRSALEKRKRESEYCGMKPIDRNMRKEGNRIRLRGFVSFPIDSRIAFLVHEDEGREYYLFDIGKEADLQQLHAVDITAVSTGSSVTLSGENGSLVEVYQLLYEGECRL